MDPASEHIDTTDAQLIKATACRKQGHSLLREFLNPFITISLSDVKAAVVV